ncbi:hypothetical protein V8F06_014868 [Rhypophila decipiens]
MSRPSSGDPNFGKRIRVDANVKEHIPGPKNAFHICKHYKTELWYSLATIDVLHCGYRMLEANYESTVAMEEIIPSNTFRVIARGCYALEEPEKTYFLLFDYKELAKPQEHEFVAKHTEKLLKSELSKWEEERRSGEHEQLCVALVERVIPRLLGPLETDGRTIDPVLVHGNLDYGGFNKDMSQEHNDGETIFHNGGVLWAHNECKILKIIPKAEPVKEWEARLRLYSLRTFIHNSAVRAKDQNARDKMMDQIKLLVDEFGGDDTPQHERPMSSSGESSCDTCSPSSAGASVDTEDLPSEAE